MASTTVDLIADTLGSDCPDPIPFAQWDLWIADAETIIGDWAAERGLALSDLDQTALGYVVREAVAARVRRPDDATQVDVSVDDGRVSRRYSSGPGQIEIRPEWWAMLTPVAARGSSGAFSIRLSFTGDPA